MDTETMRAGERDLYELRFEPLSSDEAARCFPCDGAGCVDIDALHGNQRLAYLYARMLIGRLFRAPAVHRRPGL
jgi:hypothetical protein